MAEISVDHADDRSVMISLRGELDFSRTLDMRPELLTVIQLAATDVQVNMARVSFVDCAGIGLLVEAWQCAMAHGLAMTVAGPPDTTSRRVLDILGPTLPFPVYF
jgi:anti-anti-sigma factor